MNVNTNSTPEAIGAAFDQATAAYNSLTDLAEHICETVAELLAEDDAANATAISELQNLTREVDRRSSEWSEEADAIYDLAADMGYIDPTTSNVQGATR